MLHLEAGKKERAKEDYLEEVQEHFHFFIEEVNKAKVAKIQEIQNPVVN